MYKIKCKNLSLPVIIFISGICLSIISTLFIKININVETILLLIGAFALYVVINVFVYTKATAIQVIKLSLINFAVFITSISIEMIVLKLFPTSITSLNNGLNLIVNPLILVISSLIAFLSIFVSINFEKEVKNIKKESIKDFQPETEINKDIKPEALQSENVQTEQKLKLLEEKIETVKTEEENPIPKFGNLNIVSSNTEGLPPELDPNYLAGLAGCSDVKSKESIEQNQKENNDLFEEDFNLCEPIKTESNKVKQINYDSSLFEEPENDLGNLPSLNLENSFKSNKAVKPQELENAGFQFIPENVRLVENNEPRKVEKDGIISSIGKLLVNQRDIENIIEINSVIQQVGNDADGTNIITRILGDKINEKLATIEAEYYQIRDLTLSNKAGFAIASVIKNDRSQQTIGALASGAFLTLQNYINRLNIGSPKKILFETENTTHTLFKIDTFIFYFTCDNAFKLIDFNDLDTYLNQSEFSELDFSSIKTIKGLKSVTLANGLGEVVYNNDSKNGEVLALISSAIFENLKVFIKNIQPEKLVKITIFCDNNNLVIRKFDEDILALLTDINEPIKLTKNSIKIEEIIS